MGLSGLILLAASLFVLPWLLMPARHPRPEIHGHLRVLWWINAFYCSFWHRLQSGGPAPLPDHGPAILISNHTCGIDHLLLQAGCQRVLGFMIAQEYYDFWLNRPFCKIIRCIPVKRDGRDLSATRVALRALKEGRVVPIFPEGHIVPTSGREMHEPKQGAAFIALHAKAPVIPAYICGTPETNEIAPALYTPSHARVVYGQPIDLSDLIARDAYDKPTIMLATERLMNAIKELRDRVANPSADGRPRETLKSHGDGP